MSQKTLMCTFPILLAIATTILMQSEYGLADVTATNADTLPVSPVLGQGPARPTWIVGRRNTPFWHVELFTELAPIGAQISSRSSRFSAMLREGLGVTRHGAKSLLFTALSYEVVLTPDDSF